MAGNRPKLEDVLRLLTVPQMGAGRVRRLLSIFDSTEQILRTPFKTLMTIDGLDEKMATHLKSGINNRMVGQQLALMEKHRIDCLTIWNEAYPQLLKKTVDPPVILFYKGQLANPRENCIGVVGTRMPTQYGRAMTEKLVGQLVDQGITIVSGLARGIDTIAHRAALKRGGKTHAVLGCGVDYIYPRENRQLYQQIQTRGAILSEYFIGTGPDAVNFPRRNRIISGMSLGILVVEAGLKSGALITANYAIDQNREVFAVPGNIGNPKSLGPHCLIQQGAKLVHSVDDILEEISSHLSGSPPKERPLPPNLNDSEKTLLNQLSGEAKHIDKLVLELQESPAVILARLLTLELQGLVKQLSGKMFIRI